MFRIMKTKGNHFLHLSIKWKLYNGAANDNKKRLIISDAFIVVYQIVRLTKFFFTRIELHKQIKYAVRYFVG